MKLYARSIHELRSMLDAGEISAVELTQSVLGRIRALDKTIGAYLTIDGKGALAAARAADKALRSRNGEASSPLMGIPIAVKDNICTRALRTTCGSRMLGNFVAPYDATAVSKLRTQHAVILGKTNLDEFGMGSSTQNSAFQLTRNPWNIEHVPGGSSGGSAAAVAADEAIAALGSDTGGSIRQPSSFCSVVGFKPTYGRVSRFGLVAYASSLDTVGPIAKDVEDAAIMMTAIGGHDAMDATSSPRPMPDLGKMLGVGVRGLRVGVPAEYLEGVDSRVRSVIEHGVRLLQEAGATVIDLAIPLNKAAVATYYLIAMSEASANLARYDGVTYGLRTPQGELLRTIEASRQAGLGPEVKRRIILGTFALSAGYQDQFYLKAQKVRTLLIEQYRQAFTRCHAIIGPASPVPPFRFGELRDDPMEMYLADIHTVTANLLGAPALCVPGGFTDSGLPIGIQLMAPPFNEPTLVRIGHALEVALSPGIKDRQPPIKQTRPHETQPLLRTSAANRRSPGRGSTQYYTNAGDGATVTNL